jgi:hypothetical protein
MNRDVRGIHNQFPFPVEKGTGIIQPFLDID